MKITPLDRWASSRLCISEPPALSILQAYQLGKLRDTLKHATACGRYYREHLGDLAPESIRTMGDVTRIPFTYPQDLISGPNDFVCVSPQDISRIVTLSTSGTTGRPKKIAFTPEDQELTVDFFHHGMTTLARPADRVLIFLPGKTEGSVGDLLKKAVARFNCDGVIFGPIDDYERAFRAMLDVKPDSVVGIPSQLLALSRFRRADLSSGKVQLRTVLLSTDYASHTVVKALEQAWGCEVYDHYGTTEMGLGGAVECPVRNGYHMREADLLFEVVDPVTGKSVDGGEYGEVVFTTLTRRGMPLIRYRTGDRSRMMTEACPCGSVLRRLERVSGRIAETVQLRSGATISISQLDEILFLNPSVSTFSAELFDKDGGDFLRLTVQPAEDSFDVQGLEIDVRRHPLFAPLKLELLQGRSDFFTSGTAKRRIADNRSKSGTSHTFTCFPAAIPN
jgi:phenylacetate-CoA ligase